MAKKTPVDTPETITADDLRDKLQGLQGEVQGRVDDKKATLASVAAGGGLVLMILFFLLGKRSGKKKSAIIEIRRV
jgi:hypothetical protein